jgi:hypothetical protein
MKKIQLEQVDLSKFSAKNAKTEIQIDIVKKKVKTFFHTFRTFLSSHIQKIKEKYQGVHLFFFFSHTLLFLVTVVSLFFTAPLLKNFYISSQNIAEANIKLSLLQKDMESISRLDESALLLAEQNKKMEKALPVLPNEQDIIMTLGTLLAQHKIPAPASYSWREVPPNMLIAENFSSLYQVFSYSFSSSASLSSLTAFLSDLRLNLRIIDVKSLKMIPQEDGSVRFFVDVWAYSLL